MSRKREPIAEIGCEDYRIVRHTHDVRLAAGLMRAKLLDEDGCPEMDCDWGVWGKRKVCLHKRDLGGGEPLWVRIVPALPNSYAAAEGWKFTYQHTAPHAIGAFPAVVFQ
jgi:hypothetical protein